MWRACAALVLLVVSVAEGRVLQEFGAKRGLNAVSRSLKQDVPSVDDLVNSAGAGSGAGAGASGGAAGGAANPGSTGTDFSIPADLPTTTVLPTTPDLSSLVNKAVGTGSYNSIDLSNLGDFLTGSSGGPVIVDGNGSPLDTSGGIVYAPYAPQVVYAPSTPSVTYAPSTPSVTYAPSTPSIVYAPSAPVGGGSSGGYGYDADALDRHNSYRARHRAAPLSWSDEAAQAAQNWASRCVFQHDTAGDANHPWGENLAWGYDTSLAAIDAWYAEVSQYTYGQPSPGNFEAVGHFTQLVWQDTQQVGCALQQCSGAKMYVCRYYPPGNVMGSFDREVLPP